MDRDRWQKLQALFHAARELPPGEQLAFIRCESDGNDELTSAVLAALANDLPFPRVGPYRLQSPLGEGGMAMVYLGIHEQWNTRAAIKIPRDALISRDRTERFQLEQRLLAQMQHPFIARIYEAGTLPDSTPWFAMEYVEGEPITIFCDRNRLSVRDRIELFRPVCEAVAYAHTENVIHRDLKPSNILVTPAGTVKLLDFGISKQIEEATAAPSVTRAGMHPLTLAYAAPEQVLSNQVGRQTDVYALGVVLYELLAGDLPFQVSGVSPSKIQQVLSAQVKSPSAAVRETNRGSYAALNKTAWSDIDVLISTAMHADTSKRYESAHALLLDLNRFLSGEPLLAQRDSTGYRLRKFVARHRGPVLSSAAVLLALFGMSGYFTYRLAKARDTALAEAARATRIQEFMVKLLEGGDSENGPSEEMKVGDLLKIAVKQVSVLDKDPRAQGDLYNALGTIFHQSGDYTQAESLLQSALAKRRETAGPISPEVADTLMELALTRTDKSDYGSGEQIARQALAMYTQTLPPGDVRMGKAETGLGSVLVTKGDFQVAKAVLLHALKMQAGRPESLQYYGACLNLLSIISVQERNEPEAESYTRKSIAIDRKMLGAKNPGLSDDLANLAMIQFHQEHLTDAEHTYREALAIDQEWFGAHNQQTCDMKRLLAEVLFKEEKIAEASRLVNEALPDFEKALSPDHPRIAYTLLLIGRIDLRRNDPDSALQKFARAIAMMRAKPRGDYLAVALSHQGRAYLSKSDFHHAEQSFSEAARTFANPPSSGPLGMADVQLGWGIL